MNIWNMGTPGPGERMMACAGNGNVDGLRAALAAGADVNYRRSDMAALLLALSRGQEACAAVLLDHNINVNVKNNAGWRPLHEAVKQNYVGLIDKMVELGATVTARDNNGTTAIHVAADMGGRQAIVTKLLAADASPDTANEKGVTPLMIAVDRRDLDLMDLLLEHQADPLREDKEQRSAMARAQGWVEGENRLQLVIGVRQEAQDLLQAAKAQDAGISTIAKRRRPG